MENEIKFETRAGSSGYVFATLPNGKVVEIYLQYAHPAVIAREQGMSREEAEALIAAARSYRPEPKPAIERDRSHDLPNVDEQMRREGFEIDY